MLKVFRFSFLMILASFCLGAFAQDLSGIWRGHFGPEGNRLLRMLGQEDIYKFEVQLDQKLKAFNGVTYSYKTTVFYGKATCSGTINPKTQKVFLDELKIVEVRMAGGEACIMRCWLQYSKVGKEEFLEGTYSSMNINDSTNCGEGTIFLRKVPTSDFYKEPFLIAKEKQSNTKRPPLAKATPPPVKKTTPAPVKKPPVTSAKPPVAKKSPPVVSKSPPVAKTQAPSTKPRVTEVPKVVVVDTSRRSPRKLSTPVVIPKILTSRQNELVKTITTNAREVSINIYDNGTIDNDTISVYLNKKLVINKQRLTEKAITVKFELDDETEEHELVMVAENLGEIPPNTSLMVVRAGGKQYEVRITSNEQKNAVVIFRYDKTQQ